MDNDLRIHLPDTLGDSPEDLIATMDVFGLLYIHRADDPDSIVALDKGQAEKLMTFIDLWLSNGEPDADPA